MWLRGKIVFGSGVWRSAPKVLNMPRLMRQDFGLYPGDPYLEGYLDNAPIARSELRLD